MVRQRGARAAAEDEVASLAQETGALLSARARKVREAEHERKCREE